MTVTEHIHLKGPVMDDLTPKDLKTILHSKRANLYYLEHCRVMVNGGRVEYITDEGSKSLYWNIPIANTTSILLGTGTSITQAAMRELAKAGVMIGFCSGGGTPLFTGTEAALDIEWLQPQSEYRPTEYLQKWVGFWFDDDKRLEAAKNFQEARLAFIQKHWLPKNSRQNENFNINSVAFNDLIKKSTDAINTCLTTQDLLLQEASMTKTLYKLACRATDYGDFTRAKQGSGADNANRFLDHGNYLAYGLAASAAWVLGLPHGLAILHGKTRRGGLVFDVADLIKDALVLPNAFIAAIEGDSEQEFRNRLLTVFQNTHAMDYMIDVIKHTADTMSNITTNTIDGTTRDTEL